MTDDPLRMYLVVHRGAVGDLATAAVDAGAAAVACVRDPANAEAVAAWRPRPGKVCLRARTRSQWEQVLEEPHALAGAVAALPPRRRSERGPLLEKLQAMSTDLGTAPEDAPRDGVAYLLNPDAPMSSGKTLAQVAHAAVMAAETLPGWDGSRATVIAPGREAFAAAAARADLVARVTDAGLTEVAPGTITVIALPPEYDHRMDLDELRAQEDELQFRTFTNSDAWELGCALVDAAQRDRLAVTVDIRRGEQQLFHAALPGTVADNDHWIERKNRVVRRWGHSSLYVGEQHRQEGATLSERQLVDRTEFADHGGAFPVNVRGVGLVGTVTVSGLPQAEDHRLVVEVLRAFLAAR